MLKIYGNRGYAIESPKRGVINSTCGENSAPRGKIVSWSAASRRRMREALLTLVPPETYCTYGVTLTVPGAVADSDEIKRIFHRYRVWATRCRLCAVWRLEVQSRGQLYYHLIVNAPAYWNPTECITAWLSHLGERASIAGALSHACTIEPDTGETGKWLRYLADHSTKTKQHQLGVDIGRHWGIINKRLFTDMLPTTEYPLGSHHRAMVIRWLSRLCCPQLPFSDLSRKEDYKVCKKSRSCPFGSSLGKRFRRGSRGRAVWFGRVDTVSRMCEAALDSPPF